jgi:hypothetical protein
MISRPLALGMIALTTCVAGCEASETQSLFCSALLDTRLENDRDNCGTCGNACARDDVCLEGECGADPNWALWPIPEQPLGDEHYGVRGAVVRDRITGLEWQRFVPAERVAYDRASEHCQSLELAGGGWRLPTRIELVSIVDFTRSMPAINSTVFPDTPSAPFKHAGWGSASLPGEDVTNQRIDFTEGAPFVVRDNTTDNGLEQYVRCVRQVAAPTPMGEHYAVTAGMVLDLYTHLRWARAASPPCTDCAVSGPINSLGDAESYCDQLSVDGYDDFRVPTIVELISIFDPRADAQGFVRVDGDAFPGERSEWDSEFFSSTTSANGNPWVMHFSTGYADPYNGARRVRCVRSEDQ